MSSEPWNTVTGKAGEDMPRIIPTFNQYPTFCFYTYDWMVSL